MSHSKYVLPYRETPSLDIARQTVGKKEYHLVWHGMSTIKWCNYYSAGWFDTKEEAMADLDKNLIKLGYVILTEEQALLI